MKTILITGCSSGYGLETARLFHAEGWRVVATMRTPRADILPPSERLVILPLDVTRPDSIAACLAAAGPIDVLVNNAGIGHIGALEATPLAKARQIFETNTFGVMAMTQAVIPQMRQRRAGMIVNVTSSVVLAQMPLVSVYAASKWAIEGFTECLAPELSAFGIEARLVQPGYGPGTRFTDNADLKIEDAIPPAYMPFAQPILAAFAEPGQITTAADVAAGVWAAVHHAAGRLRFPAGPDAVALAAARG
jgi:NAD(P)-dependent dehydrogenase (short-subunit alcohol dehydrogenase family)